MAKRAAVKVKAKSRPKGKPLAQTKARMNTHIRFNAKGEPRKKGW